MLLKWRSLHSHSNSFLLSHLLLCPTYIVLGSSKIFYAIHYIVFFQDWPWLYNHLWLFKFYSAWLHFYSSISFQQWLKWKTEKNFTLLSHPIWNWKLTNSFHILNALFCFASTMCLISLPLLYIPVSFCYIYSTYSLPLSLYILCIPFSPLSFFLFPVVLGIGPKALCMQGKHYTKWTISPALFFLICSSSVISCEYEWIGFKSNTPNITYSCVLIRYTT